MSWANTILSTPTSIANIENLINGMSGDTIQTGLLGNGTASIDFLLPKATAIQLNYSDGTYLQVTTSPYKYTPVNKKLITSILLVTTDNGTYDNVTIPLMLGYGYDLHDLNSNKLAVISDPSMWSLFKVNRGWYNKIAIAKSRIAIYIRLLLINQGYNEVAINNSGYQLLDIITNPTLFCLASDNLVLALIYKDLASGGSLLSYWNKYNAYMSDYKLLRDLALKTCKINQDFSGNAISNMNYKGHVYL